MSLGLEIALDMALAIPGEGLEGLAGDPTQGEGQALGDQPAEDMRGAGTVTGEMRDAIGQDQSLNQVPEVPRVTPVSR